MACVDTMCQLVDLCNIVVTPGLIGEEIILVNFTDIDKTNTTFNVAGEITLLALNAGAEMYRWQASMDSVTLSNNGTYATFIPGKFLHTVGFAGYGNTELKKNNYDSFVKGRFVAFVRTKDNIIHVAGYGVGMKGTVSFDAITNDGTWQIMLATIDPEFETSSIKTFVGTGVLTTPWEQLQALAPCV